MTHMKSLGMLASLFAFAASAALAAPPKAPSFKTEIQFQGSDAWNIVGNLVLFGKSVVGTSGGTSSVVMLKPPATTGAGWQTLNLHSFPSYAGDGEYPVAGVFLTNGQIFGSTSGGGNSVCADGCGTVFQLSPPTVAGNPWTETQLIAFGQDNNGYGPEDTVVADGVTKVFGTTVHAANDTIHPNGTSPVGGVVFELDRPAGGTGPWKETVLHHFDGASEDGDTPFGGLIIGPDHILYGTTFSGGICNQGTVYSLTPPAKKGGAWTETRLHDFGNAGTYCNYNDGEEPVAALTLVNGTLYGTTRAGGPASCGTAFTLPLSNPANYQLIYAFGQTSSDSCSPQAPVRVDASGNIFGTTGFGGGAPVSTECSIGCGTLFKLSPAAPGASYTNTILHAFTGGTDGSEPRSNLLGSLSITLSSVASRGGFATDTSEPDYASYGVFFKYTE